MIARSLTGLLGAIIAVALVVVALWGWSEARVLVAKTHNPNMALWAVRSAALSALAGAQMLGLTCLSGIFYRRRDVIDDLARLAAGLICSAALVGAMTLGLMSR